MTTVRTTLSKFLKFLNSIRDGTANKKAYDRIKKTLRWTLDNVVFGHMQHEGNVFEIPTQTDLERLIMQGGRTHKPATPRESHYSKEYLRKKRALNLPAHEWKRMGFRANTKVIAKQDRVLITVPAEATTVRGYNYGQIHESKKSVLKYAFLASWQKIIEDIKQTYADELR